MYQMEPTGMVTDWLASRTNNSNNRLTTPCLMSNGNSCEGRRHQYEMLWCMHLYFGSIWNYNN